MSEDFRGEYTQKVDAKARVSIPAAFRRVLDANDPPSAEYPRTRIVMVYGGKGRQYAECYTQKGADALARKVRRLPLGSDQRKLAERNLITCSQTVDIDDDGRIVLPQKVRDKINYGEGSKETIFAGTLETFQIWLKTTYEEVHGVLEEDEDDILDGKDVLSLLGDIEDPGE